MLLHPADYRIGKADGRKKHPETQPAITFAKKMVEDLKLSQAVCHTLDKPKKKMSKKKTPKEPIPQETAEKQIVPEDFLFFNGNWLDPGPIISHE